MRNVIIHGHFYQPPREEPWLELVPREISAAPDHDWNERITRQCYRPLARGRVLDDAGRIVRLVNAYEWCSFDIGPTLFRWFDTHAPDVAAAIVAGDRASVARIGAGNAMAMPYHHVILPLVSRRDKITEVRWGVRDFRARFGREPDGMWLPETAVDEETLEVLADERIRFTVLAPGQVAGWPPFGRPGRWRAAGGREVALFVYDGPASTDVAFGDALANAAQWETRLTSSELATDDGPNIVSVATDGETFGHHHVAGDLTLARLIDRVGRRSDAALTNFAAILNAHQPEWDLQVISPSSWSCPHGVDRWQKECGCRMEPGTSQAWRAPLFHGLVAVRNGITAAVERHWPATGGDIWTARDVAGPDLTGAPQLAPEARVLLELERHALAMFTSCAWFFDDIGRLEPLIVLRHAARALELLPRVESEPLEAALLETLAQAHSNDPAKGDGATIWRRDVIPGATALAKLAAGLAALRDLAPAAVDDARMPAHQWRFDGDDIIIEEIRTGVTSRWSVETVSHGLLAIHAQVHAVPADAPHVVNITGYPWPIRMMLRDIATPLVLDAALGEEDKLALRAGLLDSATLRSRALAGAWRLVARDGLDDAAVVVHGVLDLFDVDVEPIGDEEKADAFIRLAAWRGSIARTALAERFGDSMTPPLRFCFALHVHQPWGNFDSVFEQHLHEVYRPLLRSLMAGECWPVAMHLSGPLLEWLDHHAPDFVDEIGQHASAGRLELLCAGHDEPILAVLSRQDRLEQVLRHREWIHRRFGVEANGLWLTERVWEPTMPGELAGAGVRYILVDDRHFRVTGFRNDQLHSHFVTEAGGHRINIFPIDEKLRYLIPFRPPSELATYFRELRAAGHEIAVLGDDGEKFGGWPGTRKWLYDDGWLESFLGTMRQLRDNQEVHLSRFDDALALTRSGGLAYLPSASYREMEGWSLPFEPARALLRLENDWGDARLQGVEGGLLRGGHWRHFLVKYPESNRMHKVAMALSTLSRERGDPIEVRRSIGRAQCNDAYWHGVFGGLYLPFLRDAIWRNLAAAEATLRAGESLAAESRDVDADGSDEVWIHSAEISVIASPARGGMVDTWLDLQRGINRLNAMMRHREAYHEPLPRPEHREGSSPRLAWRPHWCPVNPRSGIATDGDPADRHGTARPFCRSRHLRRYRARRFHRGTRPTASHLGRAVDGGLQSRRR